MPKQGSQVRNRGQIIAKGERRWLVRFYAGRDNDGKRLYPAKLVEGTYKMAEQELTKMLREADTGTFIAPTKITVQGHCLLWLEGKVNLGPKTKREYGFRLEKDIYPVLGHYKLQQLTPMKIQLLYAAMAKRGLSPRTIEFTHTVFSQALDMGVRNGQLLKNPCTYLELPKKDHAEPVIFSPHEASLFLEKTRDSFWHPLWVLMLTTGLRPAEALALQWSDLDVEHSILRVQRALVEVKPGVYEPGEPKTKRGKRAIGIPAVTLEVLRERRSRLGAIAGWMFANEAGSYYDLSPIRKAWRQDIRNVNKTLSREQDDMRLPFPKLYGARHTHITHLLMVGVHPKAASDRAGHSSTNLTLNTYSHVLPEVDREAGEKIGALLFKPKAVVSL